MSEENEEIQKLLRLKRYERPPEGYYQDFLSEFQSRQRSELLKRSAHGLFFERLATYFSQFSRPQLAGAAAAACAAVIAAVMMFSGQDPADPEIAGNPDMGPVPTVSDAGKSRTTDWRIDPPLTYPFPGTETPNEIGSFVSTEGPFSDLYTIYPSGMSTSSALFREF